MRVHRGGLFPRSPRTDWQQFHWRGVRIQEGAAMERKVFGRQAQEWTQPTGAQRPQDRRERTIRHRPAPQRIPDRGAIPSTTSVVASCQAEYLGRGRSQMRSWLRSREGVTPQIKAGYSWGSAGQIRTSSYTGRSRPWSLLGERGDGEFNGFDPRGFAFRVSLPSGGLGVGSDRLLGEAECFCSVGFANSLVKQQGEAALLRTPSGALMMKQAGDSVQNGVVGFT